MGLIKYTTSLVMVALFVICILFFATNFAVDNDSQIILSSDADYVSMQSQIQANATQFSSDVGTQSEAFFTSAIKSGDVATESGGQFKAGIGTMKSVATSSLSAGFNKITGEDNNFAIIFGTISAILVFFGIAYAYKAWKGDVD